MIKKRAEQKLAQEQAALPPAQTAQMPQPASQEPVARRSPGRTREGMAEAMAKSAVRSIGSALGRQIIRGVLGSILGGKR